VDVTEFGFLKIAETVQYFLPVRRPQFGQQFKDLSFAHA
jgi:hypothetical protein